MHELLTEITTRLRSATARLEQARSEGDDYTVQVASGEIDSIARIAHDHGLTLPQVGHAQPA